ncbi:nuclear transport factor 2 family protein [soil metagenome]
MTVQQIAGGLDFETLRRAMEQLDAESLIYLYAEDAEVRMVNRYAPPSSPQILHGKAEVAEHIREVCGRDMKARIEREVVSEDRIAYNLVLEYPDGIRLLCTTVVDVRDGKIVREVGVQAWDER